MKYEYKTIPVDDGLLKDDALSKLGADGWRLVSLVFDNGFDGARTLGRGERINERTFTYVFIREKR